MTALPEPLRPWAALLSLMPEDLALGLGPHVARLAAAVGPLRSRSEAVGGEPQGYDGLDRRGPPERLLMSEWVLALEAPDEFIRRAAFGEQAFLRPAFRQPQGGRRTVVLLDAGPDQLGAPRIAHLALLVVLARRADAAGASFVWGVLQSPPEHGPWGDVNAASVRGWLKSMSPMPASPERLAAWREALGWGRAAEDVWLVGGARLGRLAAHEGVSHVEVEEVYAPGARQLTVGVRPASGTGRALVLELPPEPQCVRLLRDPFTTAVVAPVLESSVPRFVRFSADGMRLLVSHDNGDVGTQVLPHSPRDTVPRSKRFRPPRDERVVAMGWRRQGGLLVMTWQAGVLRVHGSLRGWSPATGVWRVSEPGDDELLQPPRPGEPPLLALSTMIRGVEIPWVLDPLGRLWSISAATASCAPRLQLVRRQVRALAEFQGRVYLVSAHSEADFPGASPDPTSRRLWAGWAEGDKFSLMGLGGPEDTEAEVYIGQSSELRRAGAVPPLAIHSGSQPWKLLPSPHANFIPVRLEGLRGVGLCGWPRPSHPTLVVMGTDERTFYRIDVHGTSEFLVTASSRVVCSAFSTARPHLAWLTDTGEVCAWSLEHRTLLFRSSLGGAA